MPSNSVVIDLIEQNMVINSVKSFQKVEENSSSGLSVIHGRGNIINQLNQCNVHRMISTKSKLIVMKKIVICQVFTDMIINHFFIKFRKSWKNGNGSIIFKLFWIAGFKNRENFVILRVSGKHPLTKDRLIISVKGSTIMSMFSSLEL